MTIAEVVIAFVAGFAACWFTKDVIVVSITGTQAFVVKLETKVAALKAAVKK